MGEVPHAGVGHQRFPASAEKLVQQRQVGAVVEHIGDEDQIEAIRFAEEVLRIA